MHEPRVTFRYAFPLDRNRRQLYAEQGREGYPAIETVRERVAEIAALWEEVNVGNRIMNRLAELTGARYPRDLEFCVFGTGHNAMSYPLMMPMAGMGGTPFPDDRTIEMIVHELAHRHASPLESAGVEAYMEAMRERYAGESELARDHVLIFALLEKVLGGIFDAERLKDFMQPKHPEYARARDIAREQGADRVIEEFRRLAGTDTVRA